jgi:hypothetical protein
MKNSLVAVAISGLVLVAVSGCNKPEAAPAPAPPAAQSTDATNTSPGTQNPTNNPGGMGAGGMGGGGGIPSTYTAPPSNAPPGVQQQMQRMNGGFGNR